MSNGFYYKLLSEGKISEQDLEPELGLFSFYLDAFIELGSCRNNTMSLGPIPFTAIIKYAEVYSIEDLDDFVYFIRVMDDTLIKLENTKKSNKEKNGPGNANKANKNRGKF